MTAKTRLTWNGDMSFEAELQGHRFTVDADGKFGGKDRGPRPKTLLLSGLAGCTGMDVVSLLNKMKMPFASLALEVEGETAAEHPQVYTSITIRYIFTGGELDREKIEKAVQLSLDKYCAVYAMLAKTASIIRELVLNPA